MNTVAAKNRILVVGSLHLDVVIAAPSLPQLDETVVGSRTEYVCGGKGGNQAVAARQNGAPTLFAGCIGDDEFGSTLLAHLQDHNIDCGMLKMLSGASGMSVAIINDDGDYGAVIVSGANLRIDSNAITLPDDVGLVMLQNEIPSDVNLAIAQRAAVSNIPVMLNAAPYRDTAVELYNMVDVLILNRVEAEQFFDKQFHDPDDVIAELTNLQTSISTIIVTLGAGGLVYRQGDGTVSKKSASPVDVISTHGAGDMFCGALASRINAGDYLSVALDYAMAAAAYLVSAKLDSRAEINTESVGRFLASATLKSP